MADSFITPDDDPNLPAASPGGVAGYDPQLAANLIREKVARLYNTEPNAMEELAEAQAVKQQSKHQQFMYSLSSSGKDLASIQTEWHEYYQGLNDAEKHEVWQEFYSSHALATASPKQPHYVPAATQQDVAEHKHQAAKPARAKPGSKKIRDARSAEEVRTAVRDTVTAGGRLGLKHHLQSLLFGLSMGLVVVLVFLFGFFNEVFLAPFYQPGRNAGSTPLIIGDTSSSIPTDKVEVIIPKINVEIPVNYDETSTNEATIENDLEGGIVHYPSTTLPGQTGNAAFFGHSSNNIFNKGKYKFAFVLLHTLVPGDTFYMTYNGKIYVYKVITKDVVPPSQVSVLDPVPGQTATATLITCDPPGTSLNRLIIVGQQISPDPSGNTQGTPVAQSSASTQTTLPGNGPTLLGRTLRSNIGKIIVTIAVVAAILWIFRWIHRPRD